MFWEQDCDDSAHHLDWFIFKVDTEKLNDQNTYVDSIPDDAVFFGSYITEGSTDHPYTEGGWELLNGITVDDFGFIIAVGNSTSYNFGARDTSYSSTTGLYAKIHWGLAWEINTDVATIAIRSYTPDYIKPKFTRPLKFRNDIGGITFNYAVLDDGNIGQSDFALYLGTYAWPINENVIELDGTVQTISDAITFFDYNLFGYAFSSMETSGIDLDLTKDNQFSVTLSTYC